MPAYFDTGFSVRQPMWHGQGLVLDDYPTDWTDARKKAGLEWEPAIRDVFAVRGLTADEWATAANLDETMLRSWLDEMFGPGSRIVLPSRTPDALTPAGVVIPERAFRRVIRDDTEATLGLVSDQFALVYHSQMGEILEAILAQPNVKFETAGSCKNGAQVWALAYLDEPYTVAGDNSETYPFVALLNNHDGSGAAKVLRTQVRVVCWNTYQAASMEGERTGMQFSFRHSGDVQGRIDEAIEALAGARTEAAEWDALSTELFGMPVDEATFNHFLADFIPQPIGEVVSDRVRANVDKAQTVFRSLYMDSVTTDSHRGTALGLLDASVEYLDHVRGYRSQDSYMGRTLLRPEPMKARALKMIREHVG